MVSTGSNIAVQAAVSQLGKPYAWDTPISASNPNPSSFDCSGLTMWCYHKAGISLTHYTGAQYVQLQHRPLSQAAPGDLIFFGVVGNIYHVAIYVGNSRIIEAPQDGIPVRYRTISPNSSGIMNSVGIYSGPQGGTTVGSSSPLAGNEAYIYGYLTRTLGFTDAGAAAAMGNMEVESTFSPTAYNPTEHAIGEVQWEGGRRTNLQEWARAHGGNETDIAMQMSFMGHELSTSYPDVLTAMRTATDPGTAAAYWDQHYEVSSGTTRTDRVSNARQIFNMIRSGTLTSAGFSNVSGPYTPASLHPPLSASQRAAIIAWIDSQRGSQSISLSDADLKKLPDAQLISIYAGILALANTGGVATGAINSVGDVLAKVGAILVWLANVKNWQRIGLFVLGAVLILFAAIEFAKAT